MAEHFVDTEKIVQVAECQGIAWLALFGSLARGEATEKSDIDLAVRFDKPISLFDLVDAKLALEAAIGRSVDLIPIDDVYPFVRQSMQSDLVILYDSNSGFSTKSLPSDVSN